MKNRRMIAIVLLALASRPVAAQSDVCSALDGAMVINSDGEYIGRVSNPYDSDSIFNEYGKFGSQYQSESIWNQYGKNGSKYQTGSAFNEFTSDPPILVKDRKL